MVEDSQLLRSYYEQIYDREVVSNLLNRERLEFVESDKQEKFIKGFKRNNQGCIECKKKGLPISVQDFPGWIGELKDKELAIIGLEAGPQIVTDIHIAYNLGGKREKADKDMYYRYGKLFDKLEERAYITDIAKCYSSDLEMDKKKCREICFKNFLQELELIKSLNPEIKLVFQGLSKTESLLKNNLVIDSSMTIKETIGKKNIKLLRVGEFKIGENSIPAIVIPHSARTTRPLWSNIIKNKYYIKMKKEIERYFLKS